MKILSKYILAGIALVALVKYLIYILFREQEKIEMNTRGKYKVWYDIILDKEFILDDESNT